MTDYAINTKMKAVYTRLNAVREIFQWDFEAAQAWLAEQEANGLITAIGVYDERTNTLHVPEDRPNPFAHGDQCTDYAAQLRALGITVKKLKPSPGWTTEE